MQEMNLANPVASRMMMSGMGYTDAWRSALGMRSPSWRSSFQSMYDWNAQFGDVGVDAAEFYKSISQGMSPIRFQSQYGYRMGPAQRLVDAGMTSNQARAYSLLMGRSEASAFNTLFDFYQGGYGDVSTSLATDLTNLVAGGMTQTRAQQIANIGANFAAVGLSFNAGTYANIPQAQMPLAQAIAGGDMRAMSASTYGFINEGVNLGTGPGDRWYDQYGQPVYKTDMGSFFDLIRGQWEQYQNPTAMEIMTMPGMAISSPGMSTLDKTINFFNAVGARGTDDMQAMQAWAEGGQEGAYSLLQSRLADLQRRSAGIAGAQIALRENFMWGANQGGTWDAPTTDSIWGIQDRLRALQHQSTLATYSYTKERMDTEAGFARRQDEMSRVATGVSREYQDYQVASARQMTELSRGYTDWQMGFNRETTMMQRGFTRDQWAYQRGMSNLQFGWQMEDLNEAIRMSGGYQRRQAIQARDRAATQHGMETAQFDKQQGQQENVAI